MWSNNIIGPIIFRQNLISEVSLKYTARHPIYNMYYTETPYQHQNIDKLWIDWAIKGTFSEFSFVLLVKSYVI